MITGYSYRPSRQIRHSLKCLDCGKQCKRQRTFTQADQNPDGSVRTLGEVSAAVRAQAAAWKPTLCGTCEPKHQPENTAVMREVAKGRCRCGFRWPCPLTEDFAVLAALPCLCQPVGRICERCDRLGREFDEVLPCCDSHKPGACCDPHDCSPCCSSCPDVCPVERAEAVL
jgi:hypothetical protein